MTNLEIILFMTMFTIIGYCIGSEKRHREEKKNERRK